RFGAKHALARLPEAAKLLAVDVQQLARTLALIAARAAGRGSGPRQPRAAVPTQDLADRRRWVRHETREPHRPIRGPAAGSEDPLLRLNRQPARLPPRHRRPVTQRRPASPLITPPQPIASRATRPAPGRRRRRAHPPLDQPDDLTARLPRK